MIHFGAPGEIRDFPHSAVLHPVTGEVRVSFDGYGEPPDIIHWIPLMESTTLTAREYLRMIDVFRDYVKAIVVPAEHIHY